MIVTSTFIFLVVALAAYVLFGGADFGGGLLEASLPGKPELQKKLQHTLAPVWEANHVWLIAVVVILFVGFPKAYAGISTLLFFPVSLGLLGIILRGSFFTFRKYDPDPQPRMGLYSLLFRVSSALTPSCFGFIIAGLLHEFPRLDPEMPPSFPELYLLPWFNPMGLFCAIFINALFGYLASVFFWGELDSVEEKDLIRKRILLFFLASFVSGALVLLCGWLGHLVSAERVRSLVQLEVQVLAFGGIIWMYLALRNGKRWQARFAAGMQTLAILVGWVNVMVPNVLRYQDGMHLSLQDAASPRITLIWLNIGLCIVLSLVLPLLILLYRVFNHPTNQA